MCYTHIYGKMLITRKGRLNSKYAKSLWAIIFNIYYMHKKASEKIYIKILTVIISEYGEPWFLFSSPWISVIYTVQ